MKVKTEPIRSAIALPTDSWVALIDDQEAWTFAELQHEVQKLSVRLRGARSGTFATLMDNSPAWVVADLAAAAAQVLHVPLPTFFTAEQIAHALHTAGVDALLVPVELAKRWPSARLELVTVAGQALALLRLPHAYQLLRAPRRSLLRPGRPARPRACAWARPPSCR